MFTVETNDLVGFSFGNNGEVFDEAIRTNGSNYISMHDEVSTKLKQFYFAIMLHGWVMSVSPATAENIYYDAKQLATKVTESYQKMGNNRAILLISCFTGLGFGRKLAKELQLPVLAPRSTAYVNAVGGIVSAEATNNVRNPAIPIGNCHGTTIFKDTLGYVVPNRPDWVFNHPGGNIEIVTGGSYLDKNAAVCLAEKYVTPN